MSEGWVEITADWKDEMAFVGRNAAGATIQMGTLDGQPGIDPMQLLLVALAGCTGEDIVSILKKQHQPPLNFQVKVRGKRAADFPMIWTDINVIYLVWGEHIRTKDLERAIQLSEEKYCSVKHTLCKEANITSEYHLLQPGQETY